MVSTPQLKLTAEILSKLTPVSDRYREMQLPKAGEFENDLRFRRNKAWVKGVTSSIELLLDSGQSEKDLNSHLSVQVPKLCKDWSESSDRILKETWDHFAGDFSDLALFALGKLGSEELNFSSDIDVCVVSQTSPSEKTVMALRKWVRMLTERSEYGFCYRVDFDLRPGGKSSPLIQTLAQFEDHYSSRGETWERLALIRLRPIVGNQEIIQQIMKFARKVSFRKYLDYSLFEDLKGLRDKIQATPVKTHPNEVNIKLDAGGIRDIELFVHSLQVIHGGRIVSLQIHRTTDAFLELEKQKLLPTEEIELLKSTYWRLRAIENVLQGREDQQTYSLLPEDPIWIHFPNFVNPVIESMAKCASIVATLLGVHNEASHRSSGNGDIEVLLRKSGLPTDLIEKHAPHMISAQKNSHLSPRDLNHKEQFLELFLRDLQDANGDLDLGMSQLREFLIATKAKSSFFFLMIRNPKLRKEIATLFCVSPYFGGMISRRPELLDAYLLKVESPNLVGDDEDFYNELVETRSVTELVACAQFLFNRNTDALTQSLSACADRLMTLLWTRIRSNQKLTSENAVEILAMGKWGGRELGFCSDLDFVMVDENLNSPSHFSSAKLAQRLISRTTELQRSGRLYSIDLRLKPQSSGGVLVVSKSSLLTYLETAAQPWERQAYLKARPLSSSDWSSQIWQAAVARKLTTVEIQELARIRRQLLSPQNPGALRLKYSPGGMMDIELTVQSLFLQQQRVPKSANLFAQIHQLADEWGGKEEFAKLKQHYSHYRILEQFLRILSENRSGDVAKDSIDIQKLTRMLSTDVQKLLENLEERRDETLGILLALDPLYHRE